MTYTILGKIVSDYLQLTLVTSRNWLQIESNFLSHDKSSLSIIRAHNKFNFSSSSTLDSHHLGFIQFQCVSLRHVAYVNSGTPPRHIYYICFLHVCLLPSSIYVFLYVSVYLCLFLSNKITVVEYNALSSLPFYSVL